MINHGMIKCKRKRERTQTSWPSHKRKRKRERTQTSSETRPPSSGTQKVGGTCWGMAIGRQKKNKQKMQQIA